MSSSKLTLFASYNIVLFEVAGCMDYCCVFKHFPTEMLSATVTVPHILSVYCIVAAWTNRIAVPME